MMDHEFGITFSDKQEMPPSVVDFFISNVIGYIVTSNKHCKICYIHYNIMYYSTFKGKIINLFLKDWLQYYKFSGGFGKIMLSCYMQILHFLILIFPTLAVLLCISVLEKF
jgi:hypothetical protein